MTTTPSAVTYVSAVPRKSMRIALTLATLNDLGVKCGDVLNVYITGPVKEKVWTFLGSEHSEEAGKRAIVVQDLYGFKSSGATFRTHMSECMTALGYKPWLADSDVWLKAQITNGIE